MQRHISLLQGTDGEGGEKGEDGEAGQPVSWSHFTVFGLNKWAAEACQGHFTSTKYDIINFVIS